MGQRRSHTTEYSVSDQYTRHRRWPVVLVAVLLVVALVAAGGFLFVKFRKSDLTGQERKTPSASQTSATLPGKPVPKLKSSVDYDHDGIDDYSDLVEGARKDAKTHPTYDDSYVQGGYPADNRGACTDTIWRAFRNAGYSLKDMVDADVAAHPADYRKSTSNFDPNIDFRRTAMLDVFFRKYGQTLTTDANQTDQWQQGDLVFFANQKHNGHIGMVSDRRDDKSIPYLIHNMGQKDRENDYLNQTNHMPILAHYRFDASKIPAGVLKPWH
ncbi:DUF1287 domain-containing protein [Bifidobacterium sp. ESL0745]|uniref:DUF1287 domain-containing protein n=1 Tax=Bifidobacterium sp. ESL0745 TaxID=2983226 RepID=UPI0023F7494D|nr:DUF1287 domain-containing protein [Bifidobacterium sp. ESL0745]MDF7664993.1 DUF1287 domain-containing protein [Bifidobacterium sp. ESL0745]